MSDFVRPKRRTANKNMDDSEQDTDSLKKRLKDRMVIIKSSPFMEATLKALEENKQKPSRVRCLALGSPSNDSAALYQLAYLQLLIENFDIEPQNVSLFDPVFSSTDLSLFQEETYIVEEDYIPGNTTDILYFLPHAELDLTNRVLENEKPLSILANNILTHTERLTKLALYDKYPLLSKVTNILEQEARELVKADNNEDEFQAVVSKRKSRKSRNKFVEPTLDYTTLESYFTKVSMVSFKEVEEGVWANAFTDLAYHKLS